LRAFPLRAPSDSLEWKYVLATLGAFVFTPELRRLVDWKGNFDPLNAFAVIPLLMLCPLLVMIFRRRRRLRSKPFAFVALAWIAAFGYGTFIAVAHGAVVQALFAIAQFCLPLAVGAWLLTRDETMEEAHRRIARTLLIFGAIAGVYALIQYVFAPPWDTTWMQNIDAESFGTPERFGIRAFSVLNGPGVFALFIGAVILFNLPYLRIRNWPNMLALLVMIVGLMLSLVRSAWLAVFLGIIVFVWLSPKRLQATLSILSVSAVCGVAAVAILLAAPNENFGSRLAERFLTLSNVQEDPSAMERRQQAENTFAMGLDQPAGAGLGLTGGGGKLATTDAQFINHSPVGPIDNGFATRFFELGILGFAAFLIACFASIGILINTYLGFARQRLATASIVAASCIATQIAIFSVNLSGDDQQGILGVLFFSALALPLMRSQEFVGEPVERDTGGARFSNVVRRSAFE
jgi:hypothetical protein